MLNRFTLVFASFLAASTIVSCEKEAADEKTETPEAFQTSYPVDGFASYNGVLAAIRETEFLYDGILTGVSNTRDVNAFFYTDKGVGPFIDGGFVRLNDTVYTQMDEESGVYYPINNSLVRIDYAFQDSIRWSVTGNTENDIRPFSQKICGFPSQPVPDTLVFTLSKSQPFVLKMLSTLTGIADSTDGSKVKTVFAIRQGDKVVSHEASAVTTQYQFTTKELSGFEKGEATLEIGAYRYILVKSDKKYYYVVNGSRSSKMVEIQ